MSEEPREPPLETDRGRLETSRSLPETTDASIESFQRQRRRFHLAVGDFYQAIPVFQRGMEAFHRAASGFWRTIFRLWKLAPDGRCAVRLNWFPLNAFHPALVSVCQRLVRRWTSTAPGKFRVRHVCGQKGADELPLKRRRKKTERSLKKISENNRGGGVEEP